MPSPTLDTVVSLCRRRGFVFPGSEIYGGLANTWDYGPYGVELKNNVKAAWWRHWVTGRDDVVGCDAAILMNPRAWEASGHVGNFSDPLIECKECHHRIRADKAIEDYVYFEEGNYESFFAGLVRGVILPNIKVNQHAPHEGLKEIEFLVNLEFRLKDETKKVLNKIKFKYDLKNNSIDQASLIHFFFQEALKISCPNCGKCSWTEPKQFNLMFRTQQGVIEGKGTDIYLRPETAQGIFVNFKNIQNTTRRRLPFGIAQIGKAFRNEITPGNFTFRTREFEQMEVEYFCVPESWQELYGMLEKDSMDFYREVLGINAENLRWRQHDPDELSHYSSLTKDIEYQFPWGWGELTGLAYRSDYDLRQHQEYSGESLEYLDPETNAKFLPHCIEPSFGCDRAVLTTLLDAYHEEEVGEETRVVMRFAPAIAPIKVAILPLSKKEPLTTKAREIQALLSKEFRTEYDETQSIGKRYRRQDEIGTPLCVTVDFGTIGEEADGQCTKDHVTVRDRDTLEQTEVAIADLPAYIRARIYG